VYVGHVGIGLALRAHRSAPPTALLVLAAQGPDWAEGLLEMVGVRWVDPSWSPHGLIPLGAGAVVVAVLAWRLTRRGSAAALGAVAYLSHWAADWFTGRKPTWPGGPLVGLGLYGRPARDLALEASVVLLGWWLWRRRVRREAWVPNDSADSAWPAAQSLSWALLAVLLALQFAADVALVEGPVLS